MTNLKNERWKEIPEYEGIYAVSTHGRIKRLQSCRGYNKGHVLTPALRPDGYCRLGLRKNGQTKSHYVHRLVATAFMGESPEDKPFINHIDGNKSNNHIANLEWCTRRYNAKHAVKLGLQPIFKGEQQTNAKLTADDVREIRKRYTKGYRPYLSELAFEYGVDKALIHRIVQRKSWKHVA